MIKEDDFNDKQRELYETMSDISEECYCAGWYMGNEYHIWAALHDGSRLYGMGEMDSEQLEKCRELAAELNGWIVWIDDDERKDMPVAEWGPRFVDMDEWLKRVTANPELWGEAAGRVQGGTK